MNNAGKKGNSLFIASLAENARIFETFISLAFNVSLAERLFQYRQKSWLYMLLWEDFNATLDQICIIHSLGLVSEEWSDVNIYIFSTFFYTFWVSNLALASTFLSTVSIHSNTDTIYQRFKHTVRVQRILILWFILYHMKTYAHFFVHIHMRFLCLQLVN